MSDLAIQTRGLSKFYRIGEVEKYPTIREALVRAASIPLRAIKSWAATGSNGKCAPAIWALRDLDLAVKQGEVVGIIGRNGAGKSTLLKILSGITEPTRGYADIYGRVGSLLEVGTGFHMELTGRENIFMNGALLGMRRQEIKAKFDEIVAFAETEKFLDTPVKRYSSGMYMRLAFAVAAHLEPEILIVDEVLAVGDAAFQKKCLGKMGAVAKEGRTVLFVSHNMTAVESLCGRVIWLDQGMIIDQGPSDQVVTRYLQRSFSALTEQNWPDMSAAPGNDLVRLQRACVRPENGVATDAISVRTPLVLEFDFWNEVENSSLSLNLELVTDHGISAFGTSPLDESFWHVSPLPRGLFRSRCYIPGDLLNATTYHVSLRVVKDGHYFIYRYDDVLIFEVQDSADLRMGWYGRMVGTVRPLLRWHTERIANEPRPIKKPSTCFDSPR